MDCHRHLDDALASYYDDDLFPEIVVHLFDEALLDDVIILETT